MNKILTSIIAVIVLIPIIGSWSPISAAWYNSSWQYRQQITISATLTDTALSDFPVLIYTTSSSNQIFSSAQSDGDDLLVTASDGVTKLNHEIEKFNVVSGQQELELWVKVPSLSNTGNTILYLYYGNPSCPNQQAATAVWDSNFMMVQHLEETTGSITDSTANANTGTPYNSPTLTAAGKVDGGDGFDGTNDYIMWNHSASLGVNYLTMEAYVYRTANCPISNDRCTILNKENCYQMGIGFNNTLDWAIDTTGMSWYWIITGFTVPINTWTHVAITYDGSNVKTYANGNLVTTTSYPYGTIKPNTTCLKIADRWGCTLTSFSPFGGSLDEVRVSNLARSDAWIKSTYRITSAPASYVSFGSQETQPTNTPTIVPTASATETPTPTVTLSPTLSPTFTLTPSLTPTATQSSTLTPTRTPSLTPTLTPTVTLTPSLTPSKTPSMTPSQSPTITHTPTHTTTHSPTATLTPSMTPSSTPSVTLSPTNSPVPTASPTMSPTCSMTATLTPSHVPTNTETPAYTPTLTPSPTIPVIPAAGKWGVTLLIGVIAVLIQMTRKK